MRSDKTRLLFLICLELNHNALWNSTIIKQHISTVKGNDKMLLLKSLQTLSSSYHVVPPFAFKDNLQSFVIVVNEILYFQM